MPLSQNSNPLLCKCLNEIGKEYYLDGVFVGALCGGLMITESAHGRCPNCGRGVHVVVSNKALLKLMSHYTDTPVVLKVEITE